MIKEEYSPHKIVHYKDRLTNNKCAPVHVHLITTNRCNCKCVFCAYYKVGYQSNQNFNPKDELSISKAKEILRDCYAIGVKAIQVTGGGEPLLHPNICDIFEEIKRLGLTFSLVTNGICFDKNVQSAVSGASWIRFSLDSSSPQTYQSIKGISGDNYNVVTENIKRFIEKKGSTTVGVGFVINKENYKEIFSAAKIAKELGVDNIRFSGVFSPGGYSYFDEFREEAIKLVKMADTLTTPKFTVFNLFNERLVELYHKSQNIYRCLFKDVVTYIGADLNVYVCCIKAYTGEGKIGSLKHMTFNEFWRSKEREELFANYNPEINCQHPCMFEPKNEFMEYLIKENPKHVEFI